ncbi:MAG: GyrI-like domain-containing protein [Oscillatoriales cyanobacterium RM2_1_1]|nr:GyrI-like domain-containing protein [Oscillatoriales cyanobacterium SM2_3_0]NJO44605.1 GyrI-like domain-containing protein [Oscillatoriales cyanobacterium RM2_1_1]
MASHEVSLKSLNPQWVASMSSIIPDYQNCGQIFEDLFDRVFAYVMGQGIDQPGPGLVIYHDTVLRDLNIPVEATVIIPQVIPGGLGVQVYELPGAETAAYTVLYGSFEGLESAYKSVFDWIGSNGYRMIGSPRELYLEYERGGDESKFVTEIQVPVKPMG